MKALQILDAIERRANLLGKSVTLSGFVFVYPDPDWHWDVDSENNLANDLFYVAQELDQCKDRLHLCVLLEHEELELKIQQSKVQFVVGGKYGYLCHPCKVTGVFQLSSYDPFSYSLCELSLLHIWNRPPTSSSSRRKGRKVEIEL